MADAQDLKSWDHKKSCGFKSRHRHQHLLLLFHTVSPILHHPVPSPRTPAGKVESEESVGDARLDVTEVRTKAEKGDAQAQFDLGFMYDEGKSVERDSTEATKWYRKAAEQGFAKAQLNLAAMYESGEGIPQDYKEAARWNLKASEQGITLAEVNMGRFYRDGKGVPTSATEAVR